MKYKAFISYSHAADGKLAPSLQEALQVLAKPWYKMQSFDVFRDETDLSTSPHLWESIEDALMSSEYFILLSSPESARSKWVQKELKYWLENRSIETIIIVLTEGEIVWDEKKGDFNRELSTSIPASLHGQFSGEPLYVDLRFAHDQSGLSLADDQFNKAIHPIAATLHDKSVSDLFGEIKRQHQRTIRIRNVVILLLSILLVSAIVATVFAWFQKQTAEKEQSRAESNLFAAYSTQEYDLNLTKSYRFAEAAFLRDTANPIAYSALLTAYHNPDPFFGIFAKTENNIQYFGMSFDKKKYIVLSKDYSDRGYSDSINLHILDLEGKEVQEIILGKDLNKAFLSSDGKYILGLENRHYKKKYYEVSFWDLNGHLVKTGCRHTDEIESVDFSQDGKYMLTASRDHSAILWNRNGEELQRFPHHWQVNSAVFSPDGKSVLTTCKNEAFIWDLKGVKIGTLTGHKSNLEGANYLSDGERILTYGWDNTAILWSEEGEEIERISKNDWITSVDFESGNGYMLMVSGNSAYVLYDNAFEFNTLKTNEKYNMLSAVFTPDGKHVLTVGAYENVIRVWRIKEMPSQWDLENLPVKSSAAEEHGKALRSSAKYELLVDDGNVIMMDLSGRQIIDFKLEGALDAYFSDDFRHIIVPVSASIPIAYVFLIDPEEIMEKVNGQNNQFGVWRLDKKVERDYGVKLE